MPRILNKYCIIGLVPDFCRTADSLFHGILRLGKLYLNYMMVVNILKISGGGSFRRFTLLMEDKASPGYDNRVLGDYNC